MSFNTIKIGLSLMSLAAIAACGNASSEDPLAGTWTNTSCFGESSKPADIESCSTALTFGNDLELELESEWISLAATATNPGCTTTRLVTGQKWSTDHTTNTFTVTGRSEATVERSGCVNEEDDMDATATSDISVPAGDARYTLTDDTLTVTSGALQGTYNR